MRLIPLAAACMLSFLLAPPAHADPGGVDASFYAGQETEVGEGTFEGNLSRGQGGADDLVDRYHFTHAPGKGARITAWSASRHVHLYSPDLNPQIPYDRVPVPAANGSGWQMAILVAAPGGVEFVVGYATNDPGALDYLVTVETVDIADLEVVSLVVTQVPTCPGECSPLERLRVEMTVRTAGALPYHGRLAIWVQEGPALLAEAEVVMEPGTTLTLIAYWDVLAVGDVTVMGSGSWEEDVNHQDNVQRLTYTAYVGGFQGVAVA